MIIPKKTLNIFPEPEANLYSIGSYSPKEREEKGEIYLERSKQLINKLGLKDVRELLLIYINDLPFVKTFEESILSMDNDVRNKPYDVSSTVIEKGYNGGQTIGTVCNKEELSDYIDYYIKKNMDHKTLAIVHPALIDLISLMVNKKYDIKLISSESENKARDSFLSKNKK